MQCVTAVYTVLRSTVYSRQLVRVLRLRVCVYLILHTRAIRSCHPSHSMLLAWTLPMRH